MAGQDNYSDGYVDVAERALAFFAKYPEGSLRPYNPDKPFEIIYLDDDRAQAYTAAFSGRKWASSYQPTMFICYTAAAYRTADDPMPGIGVAWEPFPGLTPYTHNSEVMNAETSSWGRAIVAVGAAEAKASNHEILLRRAEQATENAADGTMSAGAAKSGIMQATAKHVAAAAWQAMDLPSGSSVRISREDYDACLALAVRLMESTDAFAEQPVVDVAAAQAAADAVTPAGVPETADGS